MGKFIKSLLVNAIALVLLFGILWLLTAFASTSFGRSSLLVLIVPFALFGIPLMLLHYFWPEPLKIFARMHRNNKLVQIILAEQYAEIIWEENGRPPIGMVGSLLKHGYSDWYRQKYLPEQKRNAKDAQEAAQVIDSFYSQDDKHNN